MDWTVSFFATCVLLGIGLAMDAFSVSIVDGLSHPDMSGRRVHLIAGTFGVFQFAMSFIGWALVHAIAEAFASFQKWIPWIGMVLLVYLGIKSIREGLSYRSDAAKPFGRLSLSTLAVQGIATSIDALSVGFTIADLPAVSSLVECLIIGVLTYGICFFGVFLGRKIGLKLAFRASILGGVILIGIGIQILIRSLLK